MCSFRFQGCKNDFFTSLQVIRSIYLNLKAMNAGMKNEPTKDFKDCIKLRAVAIKARIDDINDLDELQGII